MDKNRSSCVQELSGLNNEKDLIIEKLIQRIEKLEALVGEKSN